MDRLEQSSLSVELRGERVELLRDHALYWPSRRSLAVADLHWGRSEILRRHGVPIPEGVLASDLYRLDTLIEETGAERLLLLGDLVHAASGVDDALSDDVARWRAGWSELHVVLVRGNHDRGLQPAPDWRFQIVEDALREGPFSFAHEPS